MGHLKKLLHLPPRRQICGSNLRFSSFQCQGLIMWIILVNLILQPYPATNPPHPRPSDQTSRLNHLRAPPIRSPNLRPPRQPTTCFQIPPTHHRLSSSHHLAATRRSIVGLPLRCSLSPNNSTSLKNPYLIHQIPFATGARPDPSLLFPIDPP